MHAPPASLPSHPLRYYGPALLASLALLLLAAFLLWQEWEQAHASAANSVLNAARMMANDVEHSFEQTNALLVSVGHRYLHAIGHGEDQRRRLQAKLAREIPYYPLVRRITVADAEGHVVFSTVFGADFGQGPSLSDRDYFVRAKAGDVGPFYAGPLHSRLNGEWSLALARRLTGSDGAFCGVVVAVLPVEAIGRFFSTIDLGPTGAINLRTADLAQVVRYPALSGNQQGIGNRTVSQRMRDLMREHPDRGVYRTVAPIDGTERVYAYQRLSRSPFYMTAGRTTGDFTRTWRITALVLAMLWLIMTAILFWAAHRGRRSALRLYRQNLLLEERVAERTRELSAILENSSVGISFVKDRCQVWANQRMTELFGYALEEMLGKPTAFLYGRDEDFERIGSEGFGLLSQGRHFSTECQMRHRDGHLFWVRVSGKAIDPSNLAQGTIWILEDIHARKCAEQVAYRFQALVESSTDAIISKTLEGLVTSWNASAEVLFGYGADEMLGQPISRLFPPGTESEEQSILARIASGEAAPPFQTQRRCKDGSLIDVSVTISPIFDNQGQVTGASKIIHDIRAAKQLEIELLQAWADAESANRAKSAFLANMSHEIRTPLNAIIGSTYLLAQGPLDASRKGYLHTIDVAGRNLLALINDVLDFSKIEAGELTLDPHDFSLPEMLHEMQLMFSNAAAAKGLTLEVKAPPAALPAGLIGDSQRLQQILINLINNAIKFTPSGRVVLELERIETDSENQQVRLRFSVTDTGIGLSPRVQTRLFQPFVQADSSTSRAFGGTGLGLSIVKRLAELMGGAVGVESEVEVGSRFWLEIPLSVSQTAPATLPVPSQTLDHKLMDARHGDRLEQVRVLVVDDSTMNLDVMRRLLTHQGAEPTLCDSGETALARLRETPDGYDLVLMDLQMPGLDGCETTRQIREHLALHQLPIIALTAGATTTEQQRASDAGMNDFLTKPVDPVQLVRALRRQIGADQGAPWSASSAPPSLSTTTTSGANPLSDPEPWPEIAGIDKTEVVNILGEDLGFFREMLETFLMDNDRLIDHIQRLLAAGDAAQAAKLVHKVRGQAGNLGAVTLREAAGALEKALKAKAPESEDRLEAFLKAYTQLVEPARLWLSRQPAIAV